MHEVADAIAQALVDTRDENVAMWKDSEILKDVVAYLTEAVCESPQVRAAFDAQAKLDAGAGRVENALRAERDALAARLAEVEAEAYYWRSLCSEDDRVEQLQRRLAEVEAERDEAVKLAYERIEKQNVETGKRVDLIHEREAFRAERDRLAQELEGALGHLRDVAKRARSLRDVEAERDEARRRLAEVEAERDGVSMQNDLAGEQLREMAAERDEARRRLAEVEAERNG